MNKKSSKRSYYSLVLMIFITLLIQVCTLVKSSIAAKYFGISIEMDAFNFVNSIGTFVFSFIGAGITTILIPNMINDKKNKAIDYFITFIYTITFFIMLIIYFNRTWIVSTLTSSSSAFIEISCKLMMITLITQFINSFLGVTNSVFQCNEKFNLPKIITLVTGIVLVLLLLIDKNLNIYMYVTYISITTIINVIIQIYLAYRQGFKFKLLFNLKNNDFRKMVRLFIPTVLSTGLYQVSLMTDTIISSRLGDGQVSILSYSNTIMSMVNTLLLTNIMTFLYPKIVIEVKESKTHKKLFDLFILLNAIMILITLGFFIVGKEGIQVLYQRGKFTSSTTQSVFICSLIYMIGLPTNALRDLMYRYFYATGDTTTPFKNSLLISILNIVISIILARFIGIYGIIIGTVITSYMSLAMIFIRFNRKYGFNYNKSVFARENAKIIIVSLIVFILLYVMKNILVITNPFLSLGIYGSFTVLIYFVVLFLFKSQVFKIRL